MDRKHVIQTAVFFSLLNLFLIALLGLTFRLFPLFSFNEFHYQNWLQVHSHAAFLGWAYTALAVLLWFAFIPDNLRLNRKFALIILALQVPVFGMYFSFPTEGYGPWSITFLSSHLILYIYLMFLIFRQSNNKNSPSFTLFKIAFWFMVLSAAGPMALGPISAMGLKQTHWYQAAIYFYLHFQYNGWFTLAILSILLKGLEQAGITYYPKESSRLGWIFTISILLTYPLSLINIYPVPMVYIPGAAGALMQIAGVYYILKKYIHHRKIIHGNSSNLFMLAGLVSFFLVLKLLAQFFTAIPSLVEFAYIRRDLVVAYLHLSLLGFISTGILLFFGWRNWLNFKKTITWSGLLIFLTGFIMTEILLGIRGFFPDAVSRYALLMTYMLIIHAAMMATGIFIMMLSSLFTFSRTKA